MKQAQRHAARQGMSFAQLVRDAVATYIHQPGSSAGSLPRLAGRYASGSHDTAERVDELLWQEPHR